MIRALRALGRYVMRPLIAVLEDLYESPADLDLYRPIGHAETVYALLDSDSDYLPRKGKP